MRGRGLEKWLCWEAATAERVAPAKSKAMTSLDLNTFEDYIKCKDEQSGVEFQVKYLLHSGTVYFEFSCGCSFKDDDSMNPLFTNGFFYFFTQGLLNGFRGKYQRKNKSIWNSDDFRKTPHLCCPKDPHLLHLLIEMLRNSRTKIVKAAAAFKNAAIIRKVARSKHAVQFKTAAGIHRCVSKKLKETMLKLNDPAFDFSFIAKDYLMPVFKNTATMPNVEILKVQFFKDRKLPEELKNALQVNSAGKALTDQQLIELFQVTAAQKERKPKFIKKKPNKGKTPSAIRKTQKPARL